MTLLITNVYKRNNFFFVELRDNKLEEFRFRQEHFSYKIGDFVDCETQDTLVINKRYESLPIDYLAFFKVSLIPISELKEGIYKYIDMIKDSNLKVLTLTIIEENEKDFFAYPAAKSVHHDFLGGLAEHTLGMLKLGNAIISLYDGIDRDLLIAGIVLHDFGKIFELENYGLNYGKSGNLLGHIVIGSNIIYATAKDLNIIEDQKVLQLNHIIISHHGKLEFGSPKLPMTMEAEIISQIDDFDSKINIMQKELNKSPAGTGNDDFTDSIFGLDKRRLLRK